MRHSVERGRASAIETGVKVAAMRDRPDGPPRHILLLSPDLGESAVEATALVEAVVSREVDMSIAVPATGREYSGYGPAVMRRLIRRQTGWYCHYPLSYQRCLTREAIDAAMPFAGRYALEAAMTISVLRAGLSVMEVPCNFAHSGADRSLGSLNRPARMFDALRTSASQVFHSDARSKRRADHEQGIGVPYPAPASSREHAGDVADAACVHLSPFVWRCALALSTSETTLVLRLIHHRRAVFFPRGPAERTRRGRIQEA